jgi:hypothetical protein
MHVMANLPAVSSERGGVLVVVALWMPVLLIFMTFVIDVGNWFEHKRHLQMQADAGALAAAQDVRLCPNDAGVEDTVARYSGTEWNRQIGDTPDSRIFRRVNKKTFYNQAATAKPQTPDDTVEAPPCEAGMIDVKLTETDLPWFFSPVGALLDRAVPFVNAQARVSFFQAESRSGSLPVAVPDVNPKSARAWFVNEATGAILASTPLAKTVTSNGLIIWDNAGAPLPVKVDSGDTNIGVVVALGGGSSTTCGQPLVDCYDAGVARNASTGLPSKGILFVRGWSAAGSGAQPNDPILRGATLVNGSCADPYFSSAPASCTIGVQAEVDFGPGDPVATVGAKLTATIGGTTRDLTYDAATQRWSSPTTFTIAPGAGPLDVKLAWEETIGTLAGDKTCKQTGSNPCVGTFGVVQRAFSAVDPRSGPIKLAEVLEDGTQWANSLERCSAVQTSCTHNMVVRIGVQSNLQNAASVTDPLVQIRVIGGSQNQSLDCDPNWSNLREELINGCSPTYGVNTGVACPENPVPAVLHCVPLQTGSSIGQLKQGLTERVFGASTACTTAPNHWSDFPNLSPDDPRIIQVILTPFGTFQGSGNESVPVTGFATFYLTGWDGSPCQNIPINLGGDDPVPDKGYVVGHFVKYIDTLNPGSGSEPCDMDAFGSCIVELTR